MTSKTFLIFIGACVYFLAASAALLVMIYTVEKSGRELESRVALINDQNAKIKMYTELSRLLEQSASQRAELSSYVLKEDQTSSFLTEIESLASIRSVQLTTQSLKVIPKDGKFDELSIEFAIEGSEKSVEEMLQILEKLPYHSKLSSVLLSKEQTGDLSGSVKLSLSLYMYDQ